MYIFCVFSLNVHSVANLEWLSRWGWNYFPLSKKPSQAPYIQPAKCLWETVFLKGFFKRFSGITCAAVQMTVTEYGLMYFFTQILEDFYQPLGSE